MPHDEERQKGFRGLCGGIERLSRHQRKDKKGEPVKDFTVKVVDARYCFPELKKDKIDIIDTYRKVAVAKLKEQGNEALAKKIEAKTKT